MEFRFGGRFYDFGSGMKCAVPAQRTGIAEWKVGIGDCVEDNYYEAYCPEFTVTEWKGNVLRV